MGVVTWSHNSSSFMRSPVDFMIATCSGIGAKFTDPMGLAMARRRRALADMAKSQMWTKGMLRFDFSPVPGTYRTILYSTSQFVDGTLDIEWIDAAMRSLTTYFDKTKPLGGVGLYFPIKPGERELTLEFAQSAKRIMQMMADVSGVNFTIYCRGNSRYEIEKVLNAETATRNARI